MNISQNLLNNAARTATMVAMSDSTATAPAWMVWVLIAMATAFAAFGAWVIYDTWVR